MVGSTFWCGLLKDDFRSFRYWCRIVYSLAGMFFLCYPLCVFSQPRHPDSLKQRLTEVSGHEQVNLLNAISKFYWELDYDSSFQYAMAARTMARQLGYAQGEAEAWRHLGVTSMYHKPLTGKPFLDTALRIFDSLHDKKGVASTFNNLGYMWLLNQDLEESLPALDSALKLFHELGDKMGEAAVLNYISINYQRRGEYQRAVDFALKGLEIRRTLNDHRGTVYSILNTGNMYLEGGQYEQALEFYNEGISFASQHQLPPFDMAYNLLGATYIKLERYREAEENLNKSSKKNRVLLGQLYAATQRPDSALESFETGLKQAIESNDKRSRVMALNGISRLLLNKGNHRGAINYAIQAYALADSSSQWQLKSDAAALLAELYEKTGNYAGSIQMLKLSYEIRDSMAGGDFRNKLAFFESKARIDREQARVQVLSAEKALQEQKLKDEKLLRNLTILIFAIALISALAVIMNMNKKRKKIQAQSDLIDTQRKHVEEALADLKATQTTLIHREKMASLGELTSGIAHEIQNPLNFVNNFSEVNRELLNEMNEKILTGDFQEVQLIAKDIEQNEAIITQHGKRADAIVKSMLQHSRTNTGQKEITDIHLLIRECIQLAHLGFQSKDTQSAFQKPFAAKIETHFDERIQPFALIPQEIGRVLINLLNNAFYAVQARASVSAITKVEASTTKTLIGSSEGIPGNNLENEDPVPSRKENLVAGAPGFIFPDTGTGSIDLASSLHPAADAGFKPTVRVNTLLRDEFVEIRIEDNGGGIPAQHLDKIFQPFFTTKPAGKGTGLGLSLSYDIVKAHGGELKVKTTEGEGSTLIIQLPVA